MFETIEEAQQHFKGLTTKHAYIRADMKDSSEEEGSVQAAFSIFDVLDTDGDIVLASAFKEGQEVPLVWSHNWGSRAIGKGRVRVENDRAVIDGKFFTDTFDGLEAYKTVKNMGDLQEWSWGFKVLDFEIEEDEKSPYGYVRTIKQAEVYEVSPVLVGANRDTETISIKSDNEVLRNLIREEVKSYLEKMNSEPNVEEEEDHSLKNLSKEGTIVEEEEDNTEIRYEALREAARYEDLIA